MGAALVSQVLFKLSGMTCMLARMTQLVHSLCRLEWLCLATLEKKTTKLFHMVVYISIHV